MCSSGLVQRRQLPFLRVKVPPTEESSAVVVISSDGKGDRPVGSLDVKAPGGWGDPVRSGAARLAAILAGESPANRGVQCCCSHIQRREGRPTRRKPGCKSPRWARETWSDPSRGASNLTGRSKREPVKPRKAGPA